MKKGNIVRLTTDITREHKTGDIGTIETLYLPKSENKPRSWEVRFQSDDSTHFVYEDEMEILRLRVKES